MFSFLKFLVNFVVFLFATKSKQDKVPILSEPRHFVLVLSKPITSEEMV